MTTSAPAPASAPDLSVPEIPARPRLGRLFRLQWEPAQDAHVLLYPEGMVKLNASAAAILLACDGARDVAAIVAHLEQQFETTGLAGDVTAWLATAAQRGWVA
ncbi:MAG: pyrroloquinoline quinone biosynthesis peptide chaperone PqqD [Comamonas sp.]